MRIGYASTTQTQYYDRSPSVVHSAYEAGTVAPHGLTTRWVYTVPTGKKAFCQSFYIAALRDAAPGPAGVAYIGMAITPSGGSELDVALVQEIQAAVGVEQRFGMPGIGFMGTGDVIRTFTQDVSTGGSYRYTGLALFVEFTLT